ncbi:MAG: hypothetical protein A2Z25_16695 [Planctomycetes bacterium RBG_16_55_9]|nr:MAG: hypothetical protein A2Z25_16695 [Planctomycetes bacterium RBG_16_55_9]
MWYYPVTISCIVIIGVLGYVIGKKRASPAATESKTTTFLIKSIQAIAELAVLEYRTEGVTEIKEKKKSLFTVRWKRGLLRYTAKLKVGFDLDRLDCAVEDSRKLIRINLPCPKVLSCEIYNRKFYKLPLEKAENIPWKYDIIEDFSSDEVLSLDEEARNNALQNVNDLYVLDLLKDKTKMAFKRIVSLSYPDYATDISIMAEPETGFIGELPAGPDSENRTAETNKH